MTYGTTRQELDYNGSFEGHLGFDHGTVWRKVFLFHGDDVPYFLHGGCNKATFLFTHTTR